MILVNSLSPVGLYIGWSICTYLAVSNGHEDCARVLLERGLDIHIMDKLLKNLGFL